MAVRARKKKTLKRPLTVEERERLKGKTFAIVCSARWADDVTIIAESLGLTPQSHHLRADLHRLGIYPPADQTPRRPKRRRSTLMRKCERCGEKWYPPQYLHRRWDVRGKVHRVCEDCAAVAALPPHLRNQDRSADRAVGTTVAPSAIAFEKMQRENRVLATPSVRSAEADQVRRVAIPSEDVNDLLEEIKVYDDTGWVTETYRNDAKRERRVVFVYRDASHLDAMRAMATAEIPQAVAG